MADKITLDKFPDLSRTERMLAIYDGFAEEYHKHLTDLHPDVAIQIMELEEKLGKLVGLSFGMDTADRNNPKTCMECCRPGPKVPSPGYEESFVRKAVRRWREQEGKK